MLKKTLPLLVSLVFAGPALAAEPLSVAVAANLQYTFDDLAAAFQRETGIAVKPSYSSSGKFVAQIQNGAPYDFFLSADRDFPEKLAELGLTATPPKVYAYGTLVLWTLKPDLNLNNWQQALAGPQVAKIAVANPRTAPYGRETMKVLGKLGLDSKLESKLVFGESISQTNQYIYSRAADAGFTAKSVVVSPEMKGKGHYVELARDSYQPIAQAMVVTRRGGVENGVAARKLYDFMSSATARDILSKNGYLLP